jgi:RNase P subunit RPR2
MKCPKCDAELIWGGDQDDDFEEDSNMVMTNFSCAECDTTVYVNWRAE